VLDDENVIDIQILFTLMFAFLSSSASKTDFAIPDISFFYTMLWQDEIDTRFLGLFLN
jgi:hypothetical protein